MKLTLLLSLLSSLAVAQVGICKPGAKCSVRDLTTTGGSALIKGYSCLYGQNAAWAWTSGTSVSSIGWTLGYTPASCTAATTVLSFSVNDSVVRSHPTSGAFQSGTSCQGGGACFVSGAGAVGSPAYTFGTDPNTGLYSIGADQLGVSTAGVRSFNFTATAGKLEGTGTSPYLTLSEAAGTTLAYGASSLYFNSTLATLSASSGVRFAASGLPTAFVYGFMPSLQTDSATGRGYWTTTATTASTPPVDFGGRPHPILQQRMWTRYLSMENAAAPVWEIAPNIGGAAITTTVVDAAVATSATRGTIPYVVDTRGSVTTAAAASTSTIQDSAVWIDINRGPRWCQRVGATLGTSVRITVGMSSALPGASDTPAVHGAYWRYSTAVGTSKWSACVGNGATTCTETSGAVSTSGTDLLCVDCREGTACTFWKNGVAELRVTTTLPVNKMRTIQAVEALSASARTAYFGNQTVEMSQ